MYKHSRTEEFAANKKQVDSRVSWKVPEDDSSPRHSKSKTRSSHRESLRYTNHSGGTRRSTVLDQPLTVLPENLEKVGIKPE